MPPRKIVSPFLNLNDTLYPFKSSGLNRRRRRRNTDGVRLVRGIRRNRRSAGYVPEVIKPNRAKPAKSYARFQEKNTNRVIVADFKLKEGNKERYHYEFAGNEFFDTLAEAERARQASLKAYLDIPGKMLSAICMTSEQETSFDRFCLVDHPIVRRCMKV